MASLIRFRNALKGVNIMTPNWMEDGKIGEYLYYELTHGRGMENQPIFGVTVMCELQHGLDAGKIVRETNLSKLFQSEIDAREHIALLREQYEDEDE